MSNSPTVSYPRKATDPAKIVKDRLNADITGAREKLGAQRVLARTHGPLTTQQVRDQITWLETEITRLQAQITTLTQTCQDCRYQVQHLEAFLAVGAQQKEE